ncbi:TetR/AcrR family transcriptional regulator [Sphingomonas sp.]|uniref:TetR/AcrR family transcriptional regulator n=1 Tax=Sphingomonas sp. TaxID=28214 RepID=UPI001EBDD4EB|nr:TetR/AcrR family transcriptional regulator [Sphingomonas sp.]MBX3595549.1 TetR/AcrR family transcriptional regulator [Sphingomonas sp.]
MARRTPPDRREAILTAARAEFAAKGYAATRLDDVAARVGISKAALYLQFADKAGLFCEMVEWMLETSLPGALPRELAGAPPRDQLSALVRFGARKLVEPDVAFLPRLVIGESGNFPEIAQAYHDRAIRRILSLMEQIIARGVADGSFRPVDPHLAARSVGGALLLGTLWKTVFEPIGADPVDMDALAAAHVDVILRGLSNGGER